MKNDLINIRINRILPPVLKPVEWKELKKKSKDKTDMKIVEQNQINKLTLKFKLLTLNLNVLIEEIKQ